MYSEYTDLGPNCNWSHDTEHGFSSARNAQRDEQLK